MASASGIRLGKVFVEIGADPSKLFGALNKLNKRIGSIGSSMANFGGRMTALGAGLAAPIGLAIRAGTSFESVLKNISASTGATAGDIGRINAAAMQLSESMGTGPTAIAQGFLELLKAGMPLEAVLSGAGKAALEFAKVGELSVAEAAVVMSDAMNVFGVDAANAANTMSAAADASSTSIQEIAQAFTQVSAVAAQSNQGIDDVAAALALMANAGVKGSDAGTSLKNMFAKLKSPVDAAATALGSIGLSTESFRDASGAMLPLAQQIEVLRNATAGLDQATKDDIFQRIFGTDAIRAALILTEAGAAGIDGMKKSMADALPVSEKYRQLQSGLAGVGEALMGSLERLAIAITAALGPSLVEAGKFLSGVISLVADFVKNNEELIVSAAKSIAIFTGVGLAITGAGMALVALSAAIGVALNPFVAIPAIAAAAIAALVAFDGGFGDLAATASTTFEGIYHAIADGDLAGAMDILWAGLFAAYLRGEEALMNAIDPWVTLMQNTFTYLSANVLSVWDAMIENMANSWDYLEATVRKGQNFLQAAFQGAEATALNDVAIDNEMADRRRTREGKRRDRGAEADATANQRNQETEDRKKRRKRDRQAAEQHVTGMASGKKEERARNQQFADLLDNVQNATTLDALRDLYGEFDALSTFGRLTPSQMEVLDEAFADAQERISKGMGSSAGGGVGAAAGGNPGGSTGGGSALAENMMQALIDSQEVAGTFSAFGLNGMGFGSNLQQLQLDALKEIAANTSNLENGAVEE
jgi:TP901 family phage tail tape measure protein